MARLAVAGLLLRILVVLLVLPVESASLAPRTTTAPSSYTRILESSVVTRISSRVYPTLDATVCSKQAGRNVTGICSSACMRDYMTPVTRSVYWMEDDQTTSAVVDYTSPHWGDSGGHRIPLTALWEAHEHKKQTVEDLPRNFSTDRPSGRRKDRQDRKDQKDDGTVQPADPVVVGWPEPTTIRPANPALDDFDRDGWSDGEKLWMSRRKKGAARLECYDYESCWDHCEKVRKRELRWQIILFSVLGGAVLLACLLGGVQLLRKWRKAGKRRDAEKGKTGPGSSDETDDDGPLSPVREESRIGGAGDAAADSVRLDGAADCAAECKTIAKVFDPKAFRRRHAVATGSDGGHPTEDGLVRRA